MSDLKQVAQQALTILEAWKHKGMWGDWDGVTDALRAALAEPVQPVAWIFVDDTGMKFVSVDRPHKHCQPLYTAPPQRTPLTDGQIHDCFQQKHKDKVTERRMITRAIEQAHGIKDA